MANLAKIIDDIATSAKLEKFFSSLKHADLPAGWQNDQGIVDAAGKLYREMGTDSPFFKAYVQNKPKNEFSIDYGMSHRPSGPFDAAPAHNVSANGMYPEDFYSNNGLHYYGTGEDVIDKQSYNAIRSVLNLPNEKVTMYRAVPNIVSKPSINIGDWVTLSRQYAKEHGESNLNNDFKILSKKVPARDVFTNADSMHEFGYFPKGLDPEVGKSVYNRGTFDPSDPNILRTATPWLAGGGLAAGSVLGGGEAQAAPYSHADANNLDRTIERLSKSMPLNDMASGMIPRATQAIVQPINNMGAWQQMEQQGRVTPDLPVPEAEWSPVDLATAPIGAAGKVGKLAAMALDAPINLAVNRLIDALSAGANTASNWWNGK